MIPGNTASQGKFVNPPTSVVPSCGNGQATVSFTLPVYDGKGVATYLVTSSPGSITASGASSPIVITGLSNGTAYTFTVTTIGGYGINAISAPSGSCTPVAPTTTTTPAPTPAPCVITAGVNSWGVHVNFVCYNTYDKWERIHDGACGITARLIEVNSAYCGYVAPPTTTTTTVAPPTTTPTTALPTTTTTTAAPCVSGCTSSTGYTVTRISVCGDPFGQGCEKTVYDQWTKAGCAALGCFIGCVPPTGCPS